MSENFDYWAKAIANNLGDQAQALADSVTQGSPMEGSSLENVLAYIQNGGTLNHQLNMFQHRYQWFFKNTDLDLLNACWYVIRLTGTVPNQWVVKSLYNHVKKQERM